MNEERLIRTFVACAVMCVRIHGYGKEGRDGLRSYFRPDDWRTVIQAVSQRARRNSWWTYNELGYYERAAASTWVSWTRALLDENPVS
jgi:hypothetical protein